MRRLLFHLLAAAAVGTALAAEGRGSVLGSTEAFIGQDSEGQPAVYAVGLVLDGEPLASLAAVPAYADCATACRADAECTVFLHCGAQVRHGDPSHRCRRRRLATRRTFSRAPPSLQAGCSLPDNSTLDSQECELLRDANCTLAPTVAARGTSGGVNPLLVSGA